MLINWDWAGWTWVVIVGIGFVFVIISYYLKQFLVLYIYWIQRLSMNWNIEGRKLGEKYGKKLKNKVRKVRVRRPKKGKNNAGR